MTRAEDEPARRSGTAARGARGREPRDLEAIWPQRVHDRGAGSHLDSARRGEGSSAFAALVHEAVCREDPELVR